MAFPWAFTILIGIYYLGSVVNRLSKARVGTALFVTIVMLAGFWTGIMPKDIVSSANLGGLYALLNLTILVNIGTTFDVQTLRREWRLVLTVLAGLGGMALLVFTIGILFFGKEFCLTSYPSLVGGTIATNLMSQRALEQGNATLAALVVLVLTIQGWFGMPLIGKGCRMECKRLLELYRSGAVDSVQKEEVKLSAEVGKVKLIDRLPKKFDNIYFHLMIVAFYGAIATVIAQYTGKVTGGVVGAALVGIAMGFVFRQLGLISRDPLQKCGLLGIFMFVMIVVLRGNLATLSASELWDNLLPIIGVVVLGAIGVLGGSLLIGRKLGYYPGMIIAFSFCCYCGYPVNYQIAMEVVDLYAENEEEREYLKRELVTRVVLGGVVSVSMMSVIVAGILVNLL